MKIVRLGCSIMICIILAIKIISCSKSSDKKIESTDKKSKTVYKDTNTNLSRYDLESENPMTIDMPSELLEISGIVMTGEERLFAQQDESGIVYELDPKTGTVVKKFSLGKPAVKDDFEDIAAANGKFYLVNSKGIIYEFTEGENGGSVEFKTYKTDLKGRNDVEGLCYDPETNSLLLACKGDAGTGETKEKAIYSFSLDKMELNSEPRFILPLSEIKKTFSPSGIQKNPKTGTFFVIASNGNEIVEISADGKILGMRPLLPSVHSQPEGITFGKDNMMYISNEGKSGKGYIVMYPYKN